jgi:hypothetical protein
VAWCQPASAVLLFLCIDLHNFCSILDGAKHNCQIAIFSTGSLGSSRKNTRQLKTLGLVLLVVVAGPATWRTQHQPVVKPRANCHQREAPERTKPSVAVPGHPRRRPTAAAAYKKERTPLCSPFPFRPLPLSAHLSL